jgi:DNA-directed RNA polymerase specialized sigma24 family protein
MKRVMRDTDAERKRRFEALFEAYGPDIVAYYGWRAGAAGDAQDAVADVFLTAWRRLDDPPEGDAARVWLYATARKVIANQRRSSRRLAALHECPRRRSMTMSESLDALRASNARAAAGFPQSVDAAAVEVRARLATAELRTPRRRRLRAATAGAAVAVAAAAAERSGTAVVRITHDGSVWAESTVRWNGDDLAVGRGTRELLVVDGMMYGIDPGTGEWVELGSPSSIDPGSGTTPAEYLGAVREDVGGATLSRIGRDIHGLTKIPLADGSTVYRGTIAAGLIARETGFKGGQAIRVLPFGYVAERAEAPRAPFGARPLLRNRTP